MKTIQQLREETNKATVDLIFTDVEMALTFVDAARISAKKEHKERRIAEATKAYRFLHQRIPTVTLTPDETIALGKKMTQLKMLLSLG